MPDTKRQMRSDSAAAAIAAAKAAAMPLPRPPDHVQISASAEAYYADIVRARARDEWNEYQLTVAAQLANCMADQDDVRAELALDGWVVINAKGTQVANPLVNIAEAMARRQMALSRSLQMTGRALGHPDKPKAKRALEKNARELAEQVEREEGDPVPEGAPAGYDPDDDLLA